MLDEDKLDQPLLDKQSDEFNGAGTFEIVNGTVSQSQPYVYFNPFRPGSLKASVFALICVTLGTGMLPLPYFFKTNGIILTLVIFFLCGFATLYTLKLLISIAYENKVYVYNDLVGRYYGKAMVNYSIVVLMINSLGSIIIWNVFIFKFLRDILMYIGVNASNLHIIYCSIGLLLFIQIPLATYKTVAEFSYVSTIGIFQILYVIIVLVIEFPIYANKNFFPDLFTKASMYYSFNINLIEMPFVFFVAFGNHSTILSVIFEISNKTNQRVTNVGLKTFYTEMLIYIMVFLFSFFSTFDSTREVFLTRTNQSLLMMIGECFMSVLMLCNISLYYYMMTPMLELFFNQRKSFNLLQSFITATIVLSILMIISLYVDTVLSILTFLGASAQVSLIFIIPIALQIKRTSDTISITKKTLHIMMLVFFTLLGMAGFLLLSYQKIYELMK